MKKKAQKISAVTGMIAGSLAMLHVANKLCFFLSTKKETLYRSNQQYYQWRFGNICYTKKGSGSPILLIHDLSTAGSSYEFQRLERLLCETHTVYSIDLLGCGQSNKPKIVYTNYLYVQLIRDFIQTIIKEKTTVVASRRSSSIAIMNSYINPDLIDQLVLINPPDLKEVNKCPKRRHKLFKWCLELPILGTSFYNLQCTKHKISNKFSKEYFYGGNPFSRYETAFYEAAHTSGSNSKYIYTSIRCHYTNTNIVHALKQLSIPILILEGSDVANGDRIMNEYESFNSNIESVLIPNTKGMPHIERAEFCYNIIEDFL